MNRSRPLDASFSFDLGRYSFPAIRTLAMGIALAVLTSAAGLVHAQSVSQLRSQIDRYVQAEDFASAAKLEKRVYDYQQRVLGPRHPQTLDALHSYVFYLTQCDQHAAAKTSAEQVYRLRKETFGATNQNTLNSMNNLIAICNETRDWKRAIELQKQYITIRTRQLGKLTEEIGTETLYLGKFYNNLRDFPKARDFYAASLQIHKQVNGEHHLRTAIARNNLGLVLYELGDYPTALSHVELAYAEFEKQLGNDHDYTASTADSIGFLLDLQGNTEEALPYYQKALQIRLRIFGEDHLSTAYSYNKMALVLDDRGEFEEAEAYYRKALQIFQNELDDDDPSTAQLINNLASCLHEQDRYEEAKQTAQQALEMYRRVYDEDNPHIADVLARLGNFCFNLADYDEAKQYFQSALAIYDNQSGLTHPDAIRQQIKLASIAAATNQWEDALAQADATFRNIDQHTRRTLVGLNSNEQLNYLRVNMADWERGYSLALDRREDPEARSKTATWLINSKGIGQETLANRAVLTRLQSNPRLAQTSKQLLDTRQNLARLVMVAPDSSQREAHQAKIAQLKQTEKTLSRQLIREMGPISIEDSWVELEDLRAKIKPGQVFINFACFTPYRFQPKPGQKYWKKARYVAWIIPPQGAGDVQVVDLGRADALEASLESVRDHLKQAGNASSPLLQDGEEAAESAYRESFAPLVQKLWKPLAEHLPADTHELILCPDSALWLLPWSAIPHAEGKYLIEDYSLSYLISGRELLDQPVETATNAPLLFADPDFDLSPVQLWQALRSIFRDLPAQPDTARSVVSNTSLGKVSSLPGTRLEAIAIAPSIEQITDTEPIKYLGKYALEGVVKRVQRPRYLVISTHGFFLPDQPIDVSQTDVRVVDNRSANPLSAEGKPLENPLLRCGLLLAGCNNPSSSGDDGVLTGLEIVGIDLRGTDLVVLSACETGVGKLQSGQGVAGLRQSFQIAGAQGIVSTLWSIPDRDSALLMNDFFQTMADGTDKADALRSAQLKRIESRRERYAAAHPYYWAAWTLTGK